MMSFANESYISNSLNHSVDFLIEHQANNGGWNSIAEPRIFETGLATLALLAADSNEDRVIRALYRSQVWLQTAIPQDHNTEASVLENGLLQLVRNSIGFIEVTDPRLWTDALKRKLYMLAVLAHSQGVATRPNIDIKKIINSDEHYANLDQLKPWARTDVIALRLLVAPSSSDSSELLDQLVAAQSSDGSFHQMVASSSLAFLALSFHNQHERAWNNCINYLLGSQQECGGWLYPDWSVWNTTLVLRTFWQHSKFQQQGLAKAISFLIDTQQADGGWGFDLHSQPDNDTTSCALLALATVLPNHHSTIIAGLEFLNRQKLKTGLWRTWKSVDDQPAQDVIAHILSALRKCSDPIEAQDDIKRATSWLCSQYNQNGFWQADWFVPPTFAVHEIGSAIGFHRNESQDALGKLETQQNQKDGGWSSLSNGPTTAAATGAAIAALSTTKWASAGAIHRGIDFLLQSQTDQGDWPLSPLVLGPRPLFSAEKINNLCLSASGLVATVNVFGK
jgi:squalene-hopene/tetraprenyl-beta-curcumene cyclase